jgi:molecular chaperone GrpE
VEKPPTRGQETGSPDPEDAPAVQVTDRRRFRPDGEPNPDAAEGDRAEAPGAPAAAAPGGDHEALAERQAARIDELTRAYAALVEDNKAFRQRLEREKERVLEAERSRVAQSLLEAHDELELAWNASAGAGEPDSPALRNLREGVRVTLQGLAKRVGEMGAQRIEVVGQPFDPRLAEAVDVVIVPDPAQEGRVVDEVRPGWCIGDRVLRPARVRVGRLPPA